MIYKINMKDTHSGEEEKNFMETEAEFLTERFESYSSVQKPEKSEYIQEMKSKNSYSKDTISSEYAARIEIIRDIEHLSLKIDKDKELKKDVDSIIDVSKKILNKKEDNPKDLKRIEKFFDYYLKTISNLLSQYTAIDDHSLKQTEINNSKKKIEETISNSCQAFWEFYSSLFEDELLDVRVESKVLDDMLKKL